MNHISSVLKLSKATLGFLQYKAAEGLSTRTLVAYEHDLRLWIEQRGDRDISQVTAQGLRDYLAWLRTDYKPRRLTGRDHPLSPKTIRNIGVSFSAFLTWASLELNIPNLMKRVLQNSGPSAAA